MKILIGKPGRTTVVSAVVLLVALVPLSTVADRAAAVEPVALGEFTIDPEAMCELRDRWTDRILATHEPGTWAPMRMELTDEDLALMGLPPRAFLQGRSFPEPTLVTPDGETYPVDLDQLVQAASGPAVASFGGAGCLGIRPGAWLLLLTGGVGWCSLAHAYGGPGAYTMSTAGHCGNVGDTATVIAAVGNRASAAGAVLLDFGRFSKSVDNGIGADWGLIPVDSAFQPLVSPTMCFWGGPIGAYTKTGATVAVSINFRHLGKSTASVNPDPFLVQSVVHYGHGTGVGAGGTPRAGTAFHWGTNTMIWEGAISPGDSGSGSNTGGGDSVGAHREAAGINTHIFVDPSLKTGIGFMASTRTTVVGTPANGQLVPYPAPFPLGP